MKILFVGELYPRVVHGISIANQFNIEVLGRTKDLTIVEEFTHIGDSGYVRLGKLLSSLYLTLRTILSLYISHDYLYVVLPTSLLGAIKTFFLVLAVRIFSKSTKIVFHLHRSDFPVLYESSFFAKWVLNFMLSICNKIIVLSSKHKLQMSCYISLDKIYVLENTVSEELMVSDKSSTYRNRKGLVFIANYLPGKGIFDLIKAFQTCQTNLINCYGEFNGNEDFIRSIIPHNVNINTSITGAYKYTLMMSSDALVFPSHNEAQPITILEAMMCGLIVLTTRVGFIEEILGVDYPFYFEEKNPKDLNRCLEFYTSYEQKNEVRKMLKNRYYKFFSNDAHHAKLLTIFKD